MPKSRQSSVGCPAETRARPSEWLGAVPFARRACRTLLLALGLASGFPVAGWAASGGAVTTSGDGFTLTVNTEWFDSPGYRPVRFTVAPLAPTTVDSTIHLVLEVRSSASRDPHSSKTSLQMIVPAGAATASASLPVLQDFDWSGYTLDVWVDGDWSRSLSQDGILFGPRRMPDGLPSILYVGDATPHTGVLEMVLPTPQGRVNYAYSQIQSVVLNAVPMPGLQSFLAQSIPDLPSRWLDYSAVDIIVLSVDELQQVESSRPDAWRAILDWARSGGSLAIRGAGERFSRLPEIESRLKLDARPVKAGAAPDPRGWNLATPDMYRSAIEQTSNRFSPAQRVVTLDANGMEVQEPPSDPALEFESSIAVRDFGAGAIVAWSLEQPFSPEVGQEEWQGFLNSLSSKRWLWQRRHGMSMTEGNSSYMQWQIPGVGLAPVTAFRLLITLFVVLIGPVNYWLLARRRKLSLLVVIVPVCALLAASALFAYALLSDGLSTRVRARSVTWLDQKNGQAACWARTSYYAALAPSDGLTFPDDVAVYPLERRGTGDFRTESRLRTAIWDDAARQLESGWLRSREITQLLTVRSRSSALALRQVQPQAGQLPRIENQLHSRIQRLLWTDGDGAVFVGADILPGAVAELQPANFPDLELVRTVNEQKLEFPLGYVPDQFDAPFGMSGRNNSYYNGREIWSTSGDLSRLEDALQTASVRQPPPRTYLALVDRSAELVFGLEEVEELASVHLIFGSW